MFGAEQRPMRELHVLMPMAGRGARFSDVGYCAPKPLIRVDDQPMFLKALSSLAPIIQGIEQFKYRLTVIIQEEHQAAFGLGDKIKENVPGCQVIQLKEVTRGAVESCLMAKDSFIAQDSLLILDCDLWFRSEPYFQLIRSVLQGKCDLAGGLLYFKSDDPRYSYAEIESGKVLRTAEKEVISNSALAGAWFFSSSDIFLRAAHALLGNPISNEIREYYVSLLYNYIIADGHSVGAAAVEEYKSYGTPTELLGA